jgi:hypothetical protein
MVFQRSNERLHGGRMIDSGKPTDLGFWKEARICIEVTLEMFLWLCWPFYKGTFGDLRAEETTQLRVIEANVETESPEEIAVSGAMQIHA